MEPKDGNPETFILPEAILSTTELGRMIRDLERLDEFLQQAASRQGGQTVDLPHSGTPLEATAAANNLNLLQPADREELLKAFYQLKRHAPILHISFAVPPSDHFLRKLIVWMRKNISPYVLLRIGLQPELGAGCTVQTRSKWFDLSLRQALQRSKSQLMQYIDTVGQVGGEQGNVPLSAEPTPQTAATAVNATNSGEAQ